MSLWRTETEISLFIYLLVSYKDFDFISIFFLVFHEFYFVEAYRKSPPHAASVITTHLLICEFLYKWVHVQYCIRITKPIKTLKGLILFVSSSANQIDWSSESQLSVTMAALEVGWVHPLTRAHFANFDLSFNQFYQVLNKRRSDYRQEVSTDNNWSIIAVLIIMISELQNKITESKYKQKKAFLCWSDENSFILIVTVSDVVTMETSEWRQ